MILNYCKTAIRNYRKRFFNTLILWIGFSAGVAAFFILSIFIFQEFSYDRFHQYADRIFRLQQNHYSNNTLTNSTVASNFAIGSSMATQFPEIESFATVMKNKSLLIYNEEVFKEDRSAYVSQNFFKFFSFKLLRGSDSLALKRPYSIVLSGTMAHKIFKDEDPIGKTVSFKGRYTGEVTGVFQDMPENSHMNFHVLLPIETWKIFANKSVLEYPWRWDGLVTYILLADKGQRKSLESKIPRLIEKENGEWLRESKQQLEINLQPLLSIHLTSNFNDELGINGSYQLVILLLVLAVAILCISWINFMNLTTTRFMDRTKEAGLRKILGSNRQQLIGQFLFESFIINLLVLLSAIGLVYFLLPVFSNVLEKDLPVSIMLNPYFIGGTVLFLFLSSLITGLYPAFAVSGIAVADVVKGKFRSSKRGKFLRQASVFIPFISAFMLLVSILVVYRQLELLQQHNLGFDPAGKLVVRDSEIYDSLYSSRVSTFKKEVVRLAGIENSTYISHVPGDFIDYYNDGVRIGADQSKLNEYRFITVDEHFTETLGLPLLAGKNFISTTQPKREIFINETASSVFGFETPDHAVGQKVVVSHDTVIIKGVLSNYYHQAPKTVIPPTYYLYNPSGGYYYLLSFSNTKEGLAERVKTLFHEIFPGQPFIYFFLEDHYKKQYGNEVKLSKAISFFLILLVIVSCVGLYSYAAYDTQNRMKEVGIRKVMGASSLNIVWMLLKRYLLPVSIALGLGLPLTLFMINYWLENYPTRIAIEWWLIGLPILSILAVAVTTISGHAWKAIRVNPASTLRNE
ncbi:MAG: FtsX-like permease family protein [Cyclobacteriaceae bacterium]